LAQLQLPDSLHSLILGRIDQLTEDQRTLLKVASVIGRLFQVAMLWGVYRSDADRETLLTDLDTLSEQELTTLDSPEPELAYLFRHVLTQEVAYETLAFATRAVLHDQIGQYIEARRAAFVEQHLDLLAHHYDRSENLAKRREFLRRAGDAAQASFANISALDYYRRAVAVEDGIDKASVLIRLGSVLDTMGDWDAAEAALAEALELSTEHDDTSLQADAQRAIGVLHRKRGDYPTALEWMERARTSFSATADRAGSSLVVADMGEVYRLQGRYQEARARYDESLDIAALVDDVDRRDEAFAHSLKGAGVVAIWQGDYDEARRLNAMSLELRRRLGDKPGEAVLLTNQGVIARFQQDLAEARRLNDEAIALFREIGDRWSAGQLLNNQACVAADQGDHDEALELLEECLVIRRQLGDRAGLNLSLITLADVLVDIGRPEDALPMLDESLQLSLDLDDRTMIAYLVEDHAGVAAARGRHEQAVRCAAFAATVRESLGAPLPPNEQARVDRMVGTARAALDPVAIERATAEGSALAADLSVTDLLSRA
jgi:adenylate cyclase